MQFNLIINQILKLFIIIFIGYIIRKKGIINNEINKGLTDILMEVTLPALIISSMSIKVTQKLINNMQLISLIWIILYILVVGFTSLLANQLDLNPKRKNVFKFLLIFGNVGYMGFPIIDAIYPEHGMIYAIIANIFFNLLLWTYGIYLFIKEQSDEGEIKLSQLLNNGLIAIFIGFIILLTGYRLPGSITEALESLGDVTIPLSMLIVGSSLSNIKIKAILNNKYIYLVSILKLLLIPGLILLGLRLFNLPTIIKNISVVLFAMPSAATTVIFAEKFDADYKFASEGVFFTTLFSLLTIPLFIYLLTV
ncbi:MAG: AEC family transporter [Bacillota bacterium]